MSRREKPFYAITWLSVPANPECLPRQVGPVLVQRQRNNLLWLNGSHCNWPKNAEILKTYRHQDWERALLAFYRDYPAKKSPPIFSAGWVAPDGSFYPCESWGHDSLAERLSANHYKSLDGVRCLEPAGWCRVYLNGIVGNEKTETQAQIDTLFDLSEVKGSSKEWKNYLGSWLRNRAA
jgi:hypothetical protein